MEASKVERAIFDWIGGRQPDLAIQLRAAAIDRREYTGHGCFVYLSSEADQGTDAPPIDGPDLVSPRLEHGAGCILWLLRGDPHCLEIYGYQELFPEELDSFEICS